MRARGALARGRSAVARREGGGRGRARASSRESGGRWRGAGLAVAAMADGAGSNGDAAGLPVGKEAGEELGMEGGGAAGPREARRGAAWSLTPRLSSSRVCSSPSVRVVSPPPPPPSGAADPGERSHLHRGPVQGVQRPAHLRVPEVGPLPGKEQGAAAAGRRGVRSGGALSSGAGGGLFSAFPRARSTPTR